MSEQTEEPQVSKSAELLKEGRRHFICREYPLAVEKLSEACELLAAEHGDGNVVLADSFYSYGEALLEMARMEGPVLGNALKGAEVIDEAEEGATTTTAAAGDEKDDRIENESLTDEAKEEISNKVIDALVEAPVMDEKKAEAMETDQKEAGEEEKKSEEKPETEETSVSSDKKEEEDKPKDEKAEDEKKEADAKEETKAEDKEEEEGEEGEEEEEEGEEGEEGEAEGEGDAEGEGEEVGEEEKAEDDVGNLQLAWEIIEVARTMYEKRAIEEKDACDKTRLRVADCHRKLAEVMLERDEWQKASEELQKCLDIELSVIKEPSRRIAETHFEMGMAFDHAKNFEESEKEFQKCISCLKEFQDVLKKKSEPSEDDKKEIGELDDLIKDVRGRCSEIKEQKKAAILAAETNGAGSSSGVTSNGFGSSNGTTSNGFGSSNGVANGHSEPASSTTGEKETQDISHLVRKRPKDTSEATGSPLKKARVSGDAPSEGATATAAGDAEVS